VISLALVVLGIGIVLHDLFYHLTGRFSLGKELVVWGIHLHHGYFGLILILIGLVFL